jgi:lactoylglutathione lyase
MIKVIHAMLRVFDEQASLNFYQHAFGFDVRETRDFSDFKLIYLKDPGSDFELELTVNKGKKQPYDKGNGYGHIALATDSIERLHADISALGYMPKPIKTFEPDGVFVARFFFVQDPDGYDIEVIERSERYQ